MLLANCIPERMNWRKREKFRNNRIVSKLVAAVNYETRYEAEKVEHTCVLYLVSGNELVSVFNEDFWNDRTYYIGLR